MSSSTLAERDSLQASDKASTKARLGAITRELHDALRALGASPELQRLVREIPDTRSRLSHVGDMTERAAHRVLNLIDEATPKLDAHSRQAREFADLIGRSTDPAGQGGAAALQALTAGAAFAEQSLGFTAGQRQILSDIMMTQDFQDLSGQVIKKVIDMITRTESQLLQLLFEDGEAATVAEAVDAPLQGPQTPENALAQDDVDDLLSSLGF